MENSNTNKIDCPLVSVVVVTYNSSATVLETLESIKAQTYQNIELIISDDCSPDDTVQVCKDWLEINRDRFVHCEIVTAEKNTGVSGNLNRGFRNARGSMLKPIAGDDMLIETAIFDYVQHLTEHPSEIFIFGKIIPFGKDLQKVASCSHMFDYSFFDMDIHGKYHYLIKKNCLPACTLFLNFDKFKEHGFCWDERIPLLEDYPMWFQALKSGVDLNFVDKYTCKYRVSDGGISWNRDKRYKRDVRKCYLLYVFQNKYDINPEGAIDELLDYMTEIDDSYETSKNYRWGTKLLAPFRVIKKHVGFFTNR